MFTTSRIFFICLIFRHICTGYAQKFPSLPTPYEIHKTNYTATYDECRDWYRKTDSAFETVKILEYGPCDGGHFLQLVVYSADKDFSYGKLHQKNKRIILIMNAIHPGEPEGVDASMLLLRDIASKKEWEPVMKDIVLLIIPQYNIEGVMNRSSYSRANQDGPESYGFRGNGENMDLNRDFIKCDSKNTRAFEMLFREWNPDVFIDNHTSDGADYQYTLTYISNMPGSLPDTLSHFINQKLTPAIGKKVAAKGFEMVPYVETYKETPDSGITGFTATPRYSMGYTGLWNTISYTVETHMLKPFDKRLEATYEFMKACIEEVHTQSDLIAAYRKEAINQTRAKTDSFVLRQEMDTSAYDLIAFKGYEASHKPSKVTTGTRLFYDRNKPWTKKIRYYNYFKPTIKAKVPEYYVLPQSWWQVVDLLKRNAIEMKKLAKDSTIHLSMYIIDGYENNPGKTPSNGHYQHHNVKLHAENQDKVFHKGDYLIPTSQNGLSYIMETLEPQGPDSYFSWNLFDGMLQQREYFSAYVFEDMASSYLKSHPDIKKELEQKKKSDVAFAKNTEAQLDWVYRHSPWFEKTYMQYPVGRIMK